MTAKKTRGDRFREQVLAEHELNASETVLLDEVAATMDEIDTLAPGAIVERRQQRHLLLRLMQAIPIPDDDGEPAVPSAATIRGRNAARARWDRKDKP